MLKNPYKKLVHIYRKKLVLYFSWKNNSFKKGNVIVVYINTLMIFRFTYFFFICVIVYRVEIRIIPCIKCYSQQILNAILKLHFPVVISIKVETSWIVFT